MSSLVSALTSNDTITENGALTNSTTDSALLDLFFIAGASRNMSEQDILNMWIKAYNENKELALSLLLWARDCRGGAGEKRFFHIIYAWLKTNDVVASKRILPKISEVGCFADLFKSPLTPWELQFIKTNIDNPLLCKWMPRRTNVFKQVASYLKMNYGDFRRHISSKSNTVEQLMSANQWKEIIFSHVPAKAMSIYSRAFGKHTPKEFTAYVNRVQKGEEKINAGTLFPYELLRDFLAGKPEAVIVEQWKALPKYQTNENILVVADVSGSMTGTPLLMSISLAMYCSEHNTGIFKDYFMTFSQKPTLQHLTGTFSQRVRQLERADWQMNTNLQATFDLILEKGKQHNVPQAEMPSKVIIISDMEFDYACSDRNNFETIRTKYEQSGYTMPQLVFWNVNGRAGNNPVKSGENGVALVSGSSPSIIPCLFGDLNPYNIMLTTICKERYQC